MLASGTIEPSQLVSVGAQVSGRLLSLKVALGDDVKAGQLIAEIDSKPQNNVVRKDLAILVAYQAQRDKAKATLKLALLQFARQTQIMAGKAGTRQDFETAEAALDTARADLALIGAQIDGATIDVDAARTDLSYTRITAPIDGTVVAILTKQGQTVISSQAAPTIVKLADLRTMTVKSRISEADVTRLKRGQKVRFSILAQPSRTYVSVLRTIEPAPDSILSDNSMTTSVSSSGSDTSVIYYNGRFDIDNADGLLRPYMTAQVSFVIDEADDAILIPAAAIGRRDAEGAHLGVVDANGQVQDRIVRIGLDNGVDVQVLKGLSVGEKVVLVARGEVR